MGASHAQTKNEGLTKLDSIYKILDEKVKNVDSKSQFEMKFKMHITYNTNNKTDSIVYSGHVISDQKKKYFFEKDKRIYQDDKVTISVLEKNKEIHFFDTPPQEYLKSKQDKFKILEDTLLSQADNIVYHGGNKIELHFLQENKLANGIQQITIKLDPEQIFSSIETIYYPGHPYSRMYTVYENIDFDSKTKVLSKKLEANIQRNGKLVSQYKNYNVYDHRKKK